jgi:hypothetical protein
MNFYFRCYCLFNMFRAVTRKPDTQPSSSTLHLQLKNQAPNTTGRNHLYNTLELLMMGIMGIMGILSTMHGQSHIKLIMFNLNRSENRDLYRTNVGVNSTKVSVVPVLKSRPNRRFNFTRIIWPAKGLSLKRLVLCFYRIRTIPGNFWYY